MATVKKHWKGILLGFVLLAALFGVGLAVRTYSEPAVAQVDSGTGGSDHGTSIVPADMYFRIQELRRSLNLTNGDLAAIGCSEQDASEVLSALRAWYEAHGEDYQELRTLLSDGANELADLYRNASCEAERDAWKMVLRAKEREIGILVQEHLELRSDCLKTVSRLMDPEKLPVWQNARQTPVGGKLKYLPSLTIQQNVAWRKHCARVARKQRVNATDGTSSEPDVSMEEGLSLLDKNQRQTLAAVSVNLAGSMGGVLRAERAAFGPRPGDEEQE